MQTTVTVTTVATTLTQYDYSSVNNTAQ